MFVPRVLLRRIAWKVFKTDLCAARQMSITAKSCKVAHSSRTFLPARLTRSREPPGKTRSGVLDNDTSQGAVVLRPYSHASNAVAMWESCSLVECAGLSAAMLGIIPGYVKCIIRWGEA